MSQEKVNILDSFIGKDVSLSIAGPCVLLGFQLQGSSISADIPSGHVWQMYPKEDYYVVTCYGLSDELSRPHYDMETTIFNTKWCDFYARTGIEKEDLWSDVQDQYQTALTAKMFVTEIPVVEQMTLMVTLIRVVIYNQNQEEWKSKVQEWKKCCRVSLLDAASKCDLKKLTKERELIYLETVKQFISDTADEVGGKALLPLFRYIVASKELNLLLISLPFLLSVATE